MVKRLFVPILLIMATTLPAMAQEDDFARVEMGFGYANYGLPASGGVIDRIHGFSMHSGLNLDSWLGIENYTGGYSAGNDITLIANIVGVKLIARDLISGRISPYLVAGLGGAYFTSNNRSGFSAMTTRFGGGIDFNLTGGMALKVDVSRLAINSVDPDGGWASNLNISTGIVFNIGF